MTTLASTTQATLWPMTPQSTKALHELRLNEWPTDMRPVERMFHTRAGALSDVEILALILGTTSAKNPVTLASELIATFGSWSGLQKVSLAELARHPGMNRQRAAQVKAALEIGRRMLLAAPDQRAQIRSPGDAAQLLMLEMSHLDQEHLRVICLDTKNRIQKIVTVYIGTLNSAAIRIGELLKEAIRLNSASVIVIHNHPSGDPTPSPEDVSVTRHIIEAGRLLDIEVLDHLIIGAGRYTSLRERGLAFAS